METPSSTLKLIVVLQELARETKQQSLVRLLENSMTRRPHCPVVLGSGRGSVAHKVHALVHAIRLEHEAWAEAADASRFASLLIDHGIEAGMIYTFPFRPAELSPWAAAEDFDFVDIDGDQAHEATDGPRQMINEGDFNFVDPDSRPPEAEHEQFDGLELRRMDEHLFDFQEAPGGARQGPEGPGWEPDDVEHGVVDWRTTVGIIDLLHIFHNAVQGLGRALQWQDEFCEMLSATCDLLRRRWSRQRMLETCFASEEGKKLHGLFKHFGAKVHSGRWGTMAEGVASLEPLESSLRLHWSLEMHNFREAGGAGNERDIGVYVAKADEGMTSAFFWSYRGMWPILVSVIVHGMHWCESCPCHHTQIKAETFFLRRQAKVLDLGSEQCPLMGCRAPEIACGEVLQFCEMLFADGATEVLLKLCPPLSEEEKQLLVSEYEAGRRHLMFYVTVKLGPWQQLPLKLLGVGHHDERKAREAVAEAFQLFEHYGDAYNHHGLVNVILMSGGDTTEQFRLFACGLRARRELPVVNFWAAKFRFVVVNARWVEGLHSRIHGMALVRRNATSATVGLTLHSPYSQSFISGSAENLATLAEAFDLVRTPVMAVRRLGLQCHPVSQEVMRSSEGDYFANRFHRGSLVDVIYHADGPTLFTNHDLEPRFPPGPAGAVGHVAGEADLFSDESLQVPSSRHAVQFI